MNDDSKEFLEQLAALGMRDQQDAALRQMAEWLYRQFVHLRGAGFTEPQALWLLATQANCVLLGPKVQQG